MAHRWLITDAEDERLQGLSADAQVIYLRVLRRNMDFATGISAVTYGQMKCAIEYIPDNGSPLPPRRVRDISNDYIRARLAELARAGLIEAQPKANRFETPVFRCLAAPTGNVCPENEPQRNPKDGIPSGTPCAELEMARVSGEWATSGTPKEPQRGNPNNTGIPVKKNTNPYGFVVASAADDGQAPCAVDGVNPKKSNPPPACPHQDIIDLYHEILPELPRVKVWDKQRQGFLRARWREDAKRQNLDWWRRFFTAVRTSPWLMGQVPGREGRVFVCTLEWLIRPTNFRKVIEGYYADRRAV